MKTRCAIYTRKSSEEGLEQAFNSLDAQREACEAYVRSQHHEGWRVIATQYDDGGFSGGNVERPALTQLMDHIRQGNIDVVVVYKVDRLSRSLVDFTRIMERFDKQGVSFVSVTQQFNTSTSMGRLTLNVLLSFAQFEREVTGERIRDKIAASKQKGLWMGGPVPLGYDVIDKNLVINKAEARVVRQIHERYLALGCVRKLKAALDAEGIVSKCRTSRAGQNTGGRPFSRGALYTILKNPLYVGKVQHKEKCYEAQHQAIIDSALWERVQARLAQNRHQRKATVKNPSLLAGLLYDDRGNPMSPTHATKNGRHYRYYISQALLQFRKQEAGSVVRIAAHEIEGPVIDRLRQFLSAPKEVLDALSTARSADQSARLLDQARAFANNWDKLPTAAQIRHLQTLVDRITVSQQQITIAGSGTGLMTLLWTEDLPSGVTSHGRPFVLSLPVTLKRCGIEMRLIVQGDQHRAAHSKTITAMQKALRQALTWHAQLQSGEVRSIVAIARHAGCNNRYAGRILRLAFLAPDIMKAIISGKIHQDLTLARLISGIPLDWDQQRVLFGFKSQPLSPA